MIISKRNEQGKRELYNHIPGQNDVKLTYVDNDGDAIELVANDIYRVGPNRTIVRDSDGKMVNVKSGNTCIIGAIAEKTVKSLSLSSSAVKKSYSVGEALDLTGLVVKLRYEDGDLSEALTSSDYTVTPVNGATLTADDTTVTVTASGKSSTFKITVTE